MVVGGEVVTLKTIEESSGLTIVEMPINVSLLLTSCSLIFMMVSSEVTKLLPTLNNKAQHIAFAQAGGTHSTFSFFSLFYLCSRIWF